MKSVLLRNLNCNSSQELIDDTTSTIINECIYSGCNLKCVNGFNFCFKHFGNKKPKIKDLKSTLISKIEPSLNEPTTTTTTNSINKKVNIESSDNSDNDLEESKEKVNTIESNLNHASVYTRDEIMKIFKTKLHRLKYLYKQQLLILNDKLVIEHKRDLLNKSNLNSGSNQLIGRRFKKNPLRSYLNQRYNPLFKESKKSALNQYKTVGLCTFLVSDLNDKTIQVKCNKPSIPLTNFCKDHILNDEHQVLFSECNHTSSESTSNSKLKHPIISSIGQECPIHYRQEQTKLDDSLVEYVQLFNRKNINLSRTNRLNCIRKKYLKKRIHLPAKKKKLTISEIFSNSNIIIQQDDNTTDNATTSHLKSIKDELIDNSDTINN